jgi:membrane fusion protein (multidrug efflux system)
VESRRAGRRVDGETRRLSREEAFKESNSMTKRMLIMLAAVGLLFGGLFGFKAFVGTKIRESIAAQGIPPQTVSTAKAQFTEWQGEFQVVGTLRAVRGADIAPEVSGLITAIHFQSGQEVAQGAPLVQLNDESDVARLQSLMAAVELAQANYDRDQKQLAIQAVSQAVVDADAATLKSAKAQAAEQRALVAKKLVRAPFAGRLGIRAVDVGQYVNAGTKLVTLQALDPVYVDFYVPQKSLGRIALGQKIVLRTDAFQGQQFPGEVSSIDPKVDLATRNVQVRATVRNSKRSLLPGMFATVVLASGGPQRFLTLPQTAISYNPFGDTVFLLEESKGKDEKVRLVAQQKFVTTGEARGDQVAILSGIKEGDTVVTAGQIKLRSGFPVVVNNAIQPTNEPSPKPKDQ